MGIRLANTGPLEQRDINGLDTHMAIVKYVYPTLENGTEPLPVHEDLIVNRKLRMKTNEGQEKILLVSAAQWIYSLELARSL